MKQDLHHILSGYLKRSVLFLLVCMCFTKSFAQQDPQYSQYMFNQLSINPAYAGSLEAISAATFLRSQWTGIEGAPKTATVTVHGPMSKKKVGLGFTCIADEVGPKRSVGFLGSYAYRIQLGAGKLSFGLRAGIYNYIYNWSVVTYKDNYDNNPLKESKWVPTADAGLHYYTNSMYVGFSATHLFRGKLASKIDSAGASIAGERAELAPHMFFTAGKAWEISNKLIFSPSLLVKYAQSSKVSADLNFSFLIDQRLWVGVSGRYKYGMVFYTRFSVTEKLKVGYAYDLGLNKIGKAGQSSHEIMLAYDFSISKAKFFSPRYF